MSELKKIIPKKGFDIPMHDGNGNLPPEGKDLVPNSYYYRLMHDGDVTMEDLPPDVPPTDAAAADPSAPATAKPAKK